MQLDQRRLRHFMAVAGAGGVTRAAAVLNLTQPALTRSIQMLEQEVGARLFVRSGAGVRLTPAGEALLATAEELLKRWAMAERNLDMVVRGESGALTIGMGPLIASVILPPLLTELATSHPSISLTTIVQPFPGLTSALLAGAIDFYVAGLLPGQERDDFDVQTIGSFTARLFVRPGHPLLAKEAVSARELAAYPLLGGTEGHGANSRFAPTLACDNYTIMRDVVARTDASWLSIAALATLADGTCLLPVKMTAEDAPPQVPIRLVSLAGRLLPPASRTLGDIIERLAPLIH